MARSTRWAVLAAVLAFGSMGAGCAPAAPPEDDDPPPDPSAPALVDEAGFLEVAADPVAGPEFASRMFYSFRPARLHPEAAPLLVLFNGGPGAATSGILLPYGTGPMTLDPTAGVGAAPVENPHALTRFANVLYLDARATGYSYGLAGHGRDCLGGEMPYLEDAADFVSALLGFLETHDALVRAPVVLVGESYGGTRAPLMLYVMQHYAEPAELPLPRSLHVSEHVPWLADRMQAHLDRAFPEHGGGAFSAAEVARQFGAQILIEPNFAGTLQMDFQTKLMAQDPAFSHLAGKSIDDVRLSDVEAKRIDEHAARAMRDPDAAAALLGVRLEDVPGLPVAERGHAFRSFFQDRPSNVAADEAKLRDDLGELDRGDAYWLPIANPCLVSLGDDVTADALIEVMTRTPTFITDAKYDANVYAKAIPAMFSLVGTWNVTWQTDLPAGAERPGTIHIEPKDGAPIDVRFPPYEAGHEVTVGAPREFAADVEAWLAEVIPSAAP